VSIRLALVYLMPGRYHLYFLSFQFDFCQDLCPVNYKGPEITAKAAASLYNEGQRENINILDIAAGTGFVAEKVNYFFLGRGERGGV